MKAMILAGGLSTRLYPLTKEVPKPLVPVAGVPNAVHVIRYLHAHGFDEIAINVHYLAEAIVDALGDGSRFGVRIEYLHEPVLLGSAGALKQLEGFFGDATFVVVGCDDLTDLPLNRALAFHRERSALATIALVEREDVEQYGVVVLDAHGKIVGFQEKPARGTELSKLANTGIYIFEPEIFAHIPAHVFFDFGKQVFPRLQAAGAPFYGFDARGAYWCDIGTLDEYRRASFDVVERAFTIPESGGAGIDPTASIAPGATIEGDAWIGPGARVGAGVRLIGPVVVGAGATLEAGARVERSILWDGARIGVNAELRGAIVGKNFRVADGARLDAVAVANEPAPSG